MASWLDNVIDKDRNNRNNAIARPQYADRNDVRGPESRARVHNSSAISERVGESTAVVFAKLGAVSGVRRSLISDLAMFT